MERLIQPLLYEVTIPVGYLLGVFICIAVTMIILARWAGKQGYQVTVLEQDVDNWKNRYEALNKSYNRQERQIEKKESLLQIAQEELRSYRAKANGKVSEDISNVRTSRVGTKTPNPKVAENRKARTTGK